MHPAPISFVEPSTPLVTQATPISVAATVRITIPRALMAASNITDVCRWLQQFVESFRFDRPGKDQSMGRDVALTIIRGPDVGGQGGILGRCALGTGPDDTPWPPNAPGYSGEKLEDYGWAEPNRRTGQMLSQQSLYGRTTIEPDQVTLRYGTGQAPSGSAAPSGHLSDQDRETPDTLKASLAHSGQSKKRVQRPFYAAAQEDAENVSAVCQENLNDYIRETNAAHGV
jgi:hypothetical protein